VAVAAQPVQQSHSVAWRQSAASSSHAQLRSYFLHPQQHEVQREGEAPGIDAGCSQLSVTDMADPDLCSTVHIPNSCHNLQTHSRVLANATSPSPIVQQTRHPRRNAHGEVHVGNPPL
jgi:hypothetical protein